MTKKNDNSITGKIISFFRTYYPKCFRRDQIYWCLADIFTANNHIIDKSNNIQHNFIVSVQREPLVKSLPFSKWAIILPGKTPNSPVGNNNKSLLSIPYQLSLENEQLISSILLSPSYRTRTNKDWIEASIQTYKLCTVKKSNDSENQFTVLLPHGYKVLADSITVVQWMRLNSVPLQEVYEQ